MATQNKPRILILGTGWGSVHFLQNINNRDYDITIVSPRSYFLFTPLLPSTANGHLADDSITVPIGTLVDKKKGGNVTYLDGEATKIAPEKNTVTVTTAAEEQEIQYDYLIVSVGAVTNTFGIPGVEGNAIYMKELEDTVKVRASLKHNFETAASLPKDDPKRQQLLSIVVVGAGPTGTEVAGELKDYANGELAQAMPDVAGQVSVTLVEASSTVLNGFFTKDVEKLTRFTMDTLEENGVQVLLNTSVTEVDAEAVHVVSDKQTASAIPCGTLIWCTGSKQRGLVVDLCSQFAEQTCPRGLLVDGTLLVQGSKNIFALGDATYTEGIAPTAQAARKQAEYLSRQVFNCFHADLSQNTPPFKYVCEGSMTYVAGNKAVAQFGEFHTGGGALYCYLRRAYYLSAIQSCRLKYRLLANWLGFGRSKVVGKE